MKMCLKGRLDRNEGKEQFLSLKIPEEQQEGFQYLAYISKITQSSQFSVFIDGAQFKSESWICENAIWVGLLLPQVMRRPLSLGNGSISLLSFQGVFTWS